MPVNYIQLQKQLVNAGLQISKRRKEKYAQLNLMRQAFDLFAGMADLKEQVNALVSQGKMERIAIPSDEPIDQSFAALADDGNSVLILASDGSQINPNRHDEISFGLINTAVFSMKTHSKQSPQIFTDSKLLDFSDEEESELNEDQIAFRRDVAERKALAERAYQTEAECPVVALTDGPLELFNFSKAVNERTKLVQEYVQILETLADEKILMAGYVDRPGSDLVVNMIELLRQHRDKTAVASARRLNLVRDSDLFATRLKSGERSAVFSLHSPTNELLSDRIQLCFFYLNTGTLSSPCIVRVEIPAWIMQEKAQVNLLQTIILQQNQILPQHPYPYALHRAHECAVVSFQEKDQVKALIIRELLSKGEKVGEKSNKQFGKDLMR